MRRDDLSSRMAETRPRDITSATLAEWRAIAVRMEDAQIDANARCADLTARLDRERGARMAAEERESRATKLLGDAYDAIAREGAEGDGISDHAWPTFEAIAAHLSWPTQHSRGTSPSDPDVHRQVRDLTTSLDECARLLGCERGGVVEALRARVDVAPTTPEPWHDAPPEWARDLDHEAPTPEPVTWAVGDRVTEGGDMGNIGEVIAVDLPTRVKVRWSDGLGPEGSWWDLGWGCLTRLTPEPTMTVQLPGEWSAGEADPRDARIAELERERDEWKRASDVADVAMHAAWSERDEARSNYGKAQESLIRKRSQMRRIRDACTNAADTYYERMAEVLRILNEGDV